MQFILFTKRAAGHQSSEYDVQYIITNEWNTGVQGEIVISDTPIDAWTLSFDSSFAIDTYGTDGF